jgi:hypothetical protein
MHTHINIYINTYIIIIGNDEKLKQVAQGFSKEFITCKIQIETQLNKLL